MLVVTREEELNRAIVLACKMLEGDAETAIFEASIIGAATYFATEIAMTAIHNKSVYMTDRDIFSMIRFQYFKSYATRLYKSLGWSVGPSIGPSIVLKIIFFTENG